MARNGAQKSRMANAVMVFAQLLTAGERQNSRYSRITAA
jgi:hypothetical protein